MASELPTGVASPPARRRAVPDPAQGGDIRGAFGTIIFFSAIMLLFAWIWDHTHGKTYTGEDPTT